MMNTGRTITGDPSRFLWAAADVVRVEPGTPKPEGPAERELRALQRELGVVALRRGREQTGGMPDTHLLRIVRRSGFHIVIPTTGGAR
jgi:hypothetical protein